MERARLRLNITLLTEQRHHGRMPNKPLRAVCVILDCARGASTSSSDIGAIPEPEPMSSFDLSSRGSTGNPKMPRDLLRQPLQMRFSVHRIHARITTSARLQNRDTHVRNGARTSTPLL